MNRTIPGEAFQVFVVHHPDPRGPNGAATGAALVIGYSGPLHRVEQIHPCLVAGAAGRHRTFLMAVLTDLLSRLPDDAEVAVYVEPVDVVDALDTLDSDEKALPIPWALREALRAEVARLDVAVDAPDSALCPRFKELHGFDARAGADRRLSDGVRVDLGKFERLSRPRSALSD
ncbi:hypothetical protein [Rhodovibrio sodomensis]|uniref:hypothetical protein n=1 Tax=Rhodovibrio sodomensis TaxID=1088 RepID=UPI00190737A5|nr:hypothetical protein [Rhodovibrio sodomensis]